MVGFGRRQQTQGDLVTKGVAVLLLGMSLASWIVIALKALDIIKYKKQAKNAANFWHSEDFAAGLDKLGSDVTDPFRQIAMEGREATAHHRNTKVHLHDTLDVSDWVTRCLRNALDEFTARLQSGLAILASLGSTAPFVGLFGTVLGIYHALLAIGLSGQSTIDKVAGPVGEALIMTALGLAVAIRRCWATTPWYAATNSSWASWAVLPTTWTPTLSLVPG